MEKVKEVLSKDPIMKSLLQQFGDLPLPKSDSYFIDLVNSIVGQLISAKAADTIYKRVVALCGGGVTPEKIIALSEQDLRAAGNSFSKIRCMKSLSEAVVNKNIDLNNLDNYGNEEIIERLTAIKGIGRWTAEMFLVFSLSREDIFSHGDGGLKNAVSRLYANGEGLNKAQITEISDKWQPYRSYASLYLWKSLDNKY